MLSLTSRGGELHEALFGDLAFTRILRQNLGCNGMIGRLRWPAGTNTIWRSSVASCGGSLELVWLLQLDLGLQFRAKASCNWIDTFFGTFEDLEGDKAPLPRV